jgi:cobyrinic acid ac-diamide synthase
MKTIAFFNNKGGVGKTTFTFHLGYALERIGKKVLFADLDPQCNLTNYTSRKGELYTDHFTIGQLYHNNVVKLAVAIKHETHILLGCKNHETLQ